MANLTCIQKLTGSSLVAKEHTKRLLFLAEVNSITTAFIPNMRNVFVSPLQCWLC